MMCWCTHTISYTDNVSIYKLVMIIALSVVALMLLIFALQVTVVWIRNSNNIIIWHKNCGVNIKLIAKYNMYTGIVHIIL